MNDDHFGKLLDAYFDGSLDAAAWQDLEQQIVSSAEARRRFWERASLEGSLESWAERSRGEALAMPRGAADSAPPRAVRRRSSSGRGFALSGWAAAAAVVVAWAIHVTWQRPATAMATGGDNSPARPVPEVAGDTPVAYLSRVHGVTAGDRILQGQTLGAGREVAVREGLLEIDFYSGARVAIQAPARFVPESDLRLVVMEGTVQVDVPDSAKGFVLALPDGTVTYGNNFGVEVKEERTSRLQVTRGEVELAATGGVRKVSEGEAVTLTGKDGARPIDFRPMAVQSSLEQRRAEDDRRLAAGWDTVCAALATDPALLVHFRLLPEEAGTREILNRSTAPDTPRTGTVIAAQWTRGRWAGKPALAFHGPADRVRVDVPGEFPQATYMAWVKIDALPRRYNGLFLSEYGIPGEAHWQISPAGEFQFGVRPKEERADWSFHRAFSPPVLTTPDFGTWRMLATTYDASRREVVHFVDGKEVHRTATGDSVPLRFGRATLGNFFDPAPAEHAQNPNLGDEWSFRNWCGAIDEFLLFSRVLDATEVARLHEAGKAE
jgi:hypothetical protein